MKSINITDILDDTIHNENVSVESVQVEFESQHFQQQKEFLNLLNVESPTVGVNKTLALSERLAEGRNFKDSESITLKPWKLTANISAQFIEAYGDVVVLECLIDKENSVYEERVFQSTLFEGFDLTIGSFFYLRFFERQHESRLQIHDDPTKSLSKDFPKASYKEMFSNSRLFKK